MIFEWGIGGDQGALGLALQLAWLSGFGEAMELGKPGRGSVFRPLLHRLRNLVPRAAATLP
ncbi:hypothetical protein [Streptomyces sp. NPDC102437]|uniref:hypothetical protein n=1 Tax=Streptomyces sp. NPDC102437 TaxID=3366175 RepID=UPI003829580A